MYRFTRVCLAILFVGLFSSCSDNPSDGNKSTPIPIDEVFRTTDGEIPYTNVSISNNGESKLVKVLYEKCEKVGISYKCTTFPIKEKGHVTTLGPFSKVVGDVIVTTIPSLDTILFEIISTGLAIVAAVIAIWAAYLGLKFFVSTSSVYRKCVGNRV